MLFQRLYAISQVILYLVCSILNFVARVNNFSETFLFAERVESLVHTIDRSHPLSAEASNEWEKFLIKHVLGSWFFCAPSWIEKHTKSVSSLLKVLQLMDNLIENDIKIDQVSLHQKISY